MKVFLFAITILVLVSEAESIAYAAHPNCSGNGGWVVSMAFTHLKNAGLTVSGKIDLSRTEVVRLASEQIGKDLYRQVHRVVFLEHVGNKIEVITINDASLEECSMGDVEVFLISKKLNP